MMALSESRQVKWRRPAREESSHPVKGCCSDVLSDLISDQSQEVSRYLIVEVKVDSKFAALCLRV